jgi:hypothetical protein
MGGTFLQGKSECPSGRMSRHQRRLFFWFGGKNGGKNWSHFGRIGRPNLVNFGDFRAIAFS